MLQELVCTVPSADVTALNFVYISHTCVNYALLGFHFVLFLEHVFSLALNSSCFSNTYAKYVRPGLNLLYFSRTDQIAGRAPNLLYFWNTYAKCSRLMYELIVFLEHVCKLAWVPLGGAGWRWAGQLGAAGRGMPGQWSKSTYVPSAGTKCDCTDHV